MIFAVNETFSKKTVQMCFLLQILHKIFIEFYCECAFVQNTQHSRDRACKVEELYRNVQKKLLYDQICTEMCTEICTEMCKQKIIVQPNLYRSLNAFRMQILLNVVSPPIS